MILVNFEVLNEVVATAEVFATGGNGALEGLVVGVDRSNMPFQMLSSEKTLAATRDGTPESSGFCDTSTPRTIRIGIESGGDSAPPALLGKVWHRDRGSLAYSETR